MGGGNPDEGDAEATLLFALNAEFAAARESGLDDEACGRVIAYLANRWAPRVEAA